MAQMTALKKKALATALMKVKWKIPMIAPIMLALKTMGSSDELSEEVFDEGSDEAQTMTQMKFPEKAQKEKVTSKVSDEGFKLSLFTITVYMK